MTPNQIVAFNIRLWRIEHNMTQEELAAHVEPYIGTRWSKATVSTIERSVDGKRIRYFTADDIMALATAFDCSPIDLLTEPKFCSECGRPLPPDGYPHSRVILNQ